MTLLDQLQFEGCRPEPVDLSHEERRKFFFHARYQAYQAMMMGVQARKLSTPVMVKPFQEGALRWLEIARDVFPLTRDRETCSIEDILNGKEPAEFDPREAGRASDA